MRFRTLDIVVFLFILDVASTIIPNVTNVADINNDLKGVETRRRKKKKDRSTSSSDRDRGRDSDSEGDKESLQLSSDLQTSSSGESKDRVGIPKSSAERKGWRKWHRKCTPCPEDMAKKWRDPSINWICGGYQRARRSFKSLCMMYYRNCQDGTMFVKIHDHRCADDTTQDQRQGMHFFYDYKVRLEDESSKTDENDPSSESLTDTS